MLARWTVGLIAALAMAGCGGSGSTAPTTAEGAYTLSSVDGSALPATIASPVYGSAQVAFSHLELSADNAYHDSTVLTCACAGGTVTQIDDGTWSASGSTVTIQTATWTVTATLAGPDLRVPFAGTALGSYTYAYARQ